MNAHYSYHPFSANRLVYRGEPGRTLEDITAPLMDFEDLRAVVKDQSASAQTAQTAQLASLKVGPSFRGKAEKMRESVKKKLKESLGNSQKLQVLVDFYKDHSTFTVGTDAAKQWSIDFYNIFFAEDGEDPNQTTFEKAQPYICALQMALDDLFEEQTGFSYELKEGGFTHPMTAIDGYMGAYAVNALVSYIWMNVGLDDAQKASLENYISYEGASDAKRNSYNETTKYLVKINEANNSEDGVAATPAPTQPAGGEIAPAPAVIESPEVAGDSAKNDYLSFLSGGLGIPSQLDTQNFRKVFEKVDAHIKNKENENQDFQFPITLGEWEAVFREAALDADEIDVILPPLIRENLKKIDDIYSKYNEAYLTGIRSHYLDLGLTEDISDGVFPHNTRKYQTTMRKVVTYLHRPVLGSDGHKNTPANYIPNDFLGWMTAFDKIRGGGLLSIKEWEVLYPKKILDSAVEKEKALYIEAQKQWWEKECRLYYTQYASDLKKDLGEQVDYPQFNDPKFHDIFMSVVKRSSNIPNNFSKWLDQFRAMEIPSEALHVLVPQKWFEREEERERIQSQPDVNALPTLTSPFDLKGNEWKMLDENYDELTEEYMELVNDLDDPPENSPEAIKTVYSDFRKKQERVIFLKAQAFKSPGELSKAEAEAKQANEVLFREIEKCRIRSYEGAQEFAKQYTLPNDIRLTYNSKLVANIYSDYIPRTTGINIDSVMLNLGRTHFFNNFRELVEACDENKLLDLQRTLMTTNYLAKDEEALRDAKGNYWRSVGYLDNLEQHNAARILQLFNSTIAIRNITKLERAREQWYLEVN